MAWHLDFSLLTTWRARSSLRWNSDQPARRTSSREGSAGWLIVDVEAAVGDVQLVVVAMEAAVDGDIGAVACVAKLSVIVETTVL